MTPDWMKPLYDLLGLEVGVVLSNSDRDDRRRAYAADITYGPQKTSDLTF